MLERRALNEGSGFEVAAAYSRALRIGRHVAVSGTAPVEHGVVLHPGNAYAQTLAALRKALAAASALGADAGDVIRTRLLLVPEADWEGAVRAHGEVFAGIEPANTTYFVAALIPKDVLVEVELDAVVADRDLDEL